MALEKAQLGPLGWFYLAFVICWNVSLVVAMSFLWKHRELPSIRMRRIPLLFSGVVALHIYGAISFFAYPFGAYFPCSVIFWMMSILVPFGMAMFQASNTQFLHVASRQKQLAHMSTLSDKKPISEKQAEAMGNNRFSRILSGVERADKVNRSLILIGVGMIVQIAVTLLVFLGSEKFHPGFGLWDYTVQGTEAELYLKCNQGWEWWMSIVWQFVWAWIYAPYMIWKSRGVRDVHGWRLQTICCCIVGLPASPLWLAGLYAPSMATVGAYVPPPTWFGFSIFLMEVVTLGFPIVGIFRAQSLKQETLEAIADWEKRQALENLDGTGAAPEGSLKSHSVYSDTYSKTTTLKSSGDMTVNSLESSKSGMLTMTALENALRSNAAPLLEFAALKDFSGENVSFLTHVADWRRFWFIPKASTAEHRRQQFIAATHIYARFISLEFSEFPINISSREMKRLFNVFDSAAVALYRNKRGSLSSEVSDSATPFDNVHPDDASAADSHMPPSPTGSTFGLKNLDALGRANLRAVSRLDGLYSDEKYADIEIPDTFAEVIFDPAESEIKYLVLTNTWPKFVNAGRAASQISKDEETGAGWKQKMLCDRN